MNAKSLLRSVTLALVAFAAMMPSSMKAFVFEEGGIYYDVSGTEAIVTYGSQGYNSYSGNVVIPEKVTHNGATYTVTAIGYSAFSRSSGLTSVTIPNTIKTIGEHCFTYCTALQEVVIPNSVVKVGRCAFHTCSSLKSAVIGNSVTVLDEYCFQYCGQLTDVVIGSSVNYLAIKVFYDCYSLKNITCLAPEPPVMYEWYSFYETNYSNATVHVVGSSMAAYKADNYWGQFSKYASLTTATSLKLDESLVILKDGEQKQLTATVEPADASSTLNWSSSNSQVASVNADGVVTAVGAGETVITAATLDGSDLTAKCIVRVLSNGVQDDNMLSVPVSISLENGMSYKLPVEMLNVADISAVQCDIVLPEGIELAQDDGQYLVDLNDERVAPSHVLNIRQLSSGALRVLITSLTAEPFSGNDGDLFVLHLNVTPEIEDGVYTLALTNVVMADVNALTYYAPDVTTLVEVKSYAKGDANGDGTVNVGDYVTTANYIMELEPDPFLFKAADVDENGTIDVGDLVGITNIIMGDDETNVEPNSEGGEVKMAGQCATSGDNTCTMTLDLTNDMALTAWQMDVELPEGVTLQQAKLTSRAAGHNLVVSECGNGHIKLLASSPLNAELLGNEGALLTLTLDNNSGSDGDVTFDNIVMAERDMTTHKVGAFKVGTGQSAVNEIRSDVRIYAKDGNIVVETPVEATVEIIMTNGMSHTFKAQAGVNTYPAAKGIHIVRAAGQVAKLKI